MSGRGDFSGEAQRADGREGVQPRRSGRPHAGAVALFGALVAILLFGSKALERATEVRLGERFASPGWEHFLGTDDRGRDTFSRAAVCLAATGAMLTGLWAIALFAGTAAGLARAAAPRALRPATDALDRCWDCFPMVLLGGALVISSGASGPGVLLLLGAMGAVPVSRRVGDAVAAIARHDCYLAAAASGVPARRLFLRYRVPQAGRAGFHGALAFLAPALIWESSLGFLSPRVAVTSWSLGSMVREGSPYFMDAPRLVFVPAGILFALVLCFRLLEAASASRLNRSLSLLNS